MWRFVHLSARLCVRPSVCWCFLATICAPSVLTSAPGDRFDDWHRLHRVPRRRHRQTARLGQAGGQGRGHPRNEGSHLGLYQLHAGHRSVREACLRARVGDENVEKNKIRRSKMCFLVTPAFVLFSRFFRFRLLALFSFSAVVLFSSTNRTRLTIVRTYCTYYDSNRTYV